MERVLSPSQHHRAVLSTTRSASRSPSSRVILTTPMENGEEVPNKRTFTPDAIGDYVFTLTVKDPGELTHSANVTIHACSATGTSQWYDTGETRVVDGVLEKKQTRWHNGAAKFQWVPPNNPPKPSPATMTLCCRTLQCT